MFRQVIPNSSQNSSNARYEYYLVWLSVSGGVRSWLFSHTDGDDMEKLDNIHIESRDSIRSVPTMQRKTVTAITRSLDAESYNYVKSVLSSNKVYLVGKDFSKTPVAMKKSSITQDNKIKEFSLKIKFSFKENDILNV
jgi:hypothetical protein